MHVVRSELVDELLASCDHGAVADAASAPVVINVLTHGTSEPCAPREDPDGDLELPRRKRQRRQRAAPPDEATAQLSDDDEVASIVLETMAEGSADATGTQLWRASFLLAEYLQSQADQLREAVVLELGCGVGFVAVAAARLARRVYATDGDRSALAVCRRNADRNAWSRDRVRVQYLKWGSNAMIDCGADDCTSDAGIEFFTLWPSHDGASENDRRVNWIVASDVFYDDVVADLFLDTLHQLMQQHPTAKVVVAAEKRVVFSAVTMSEIALGYDAFQQRLCHHDSPTQASGSCVHTCQECSSVSSSAEATKRRFVAVRIPTASIPRIYAYERVSTLHIWQLHAVIRPS